MFMNYAVYTHKAEGDYAVKKKIMIGIVIVSFVIVTVLVYSLGIVNLDYLFKGNLESISITSMSKDDSISYVIEHEANKENFKKVFFNKITTALGPTTAEGGNYKVVFHYEKATLSFDVVLNESSSINSYIKYHNKARDYSLSEEDVSFLKDFIDENDIE